MSDEQYAALVRVVRANTRALRWLVGAVSLLVLMHGREILALVGRVP